MTNPEYLRARQLMRVTLVASIVTGVVWIVTSWLVQRSRLPPKRI